MSEFSIYHIDDCMYVAATTIESAIAYVREECGEGCGDPEWAYEISADRPVETANVEDGETPTADSKKPMRELVEAHLAGGGTLPYSVAFDND